MKYLQPVRTLVTAGEGSEPVCGQNRTGFYLGINPDHQLVGNVTSHRNISPQTGLECAQIAAHFVQQYTCGEG